MTTHFNEMGACIQNLQSIICETTKLQDSLFFLLLRCCPHRLLLVSPQLLEETHIGTRKWPLFINKVGSI